MSIFFVFQIQKSNQFCAEKWFRTMIYKQASLAWRPTHDVHCQNAPLLPKRATAAHRGHCCKMHTDVTVANKRRCCPHAPLLLTRATVAHRHHCWPHAPLLPTRGTVAHRRRTMPLTRRWRLDESTVWNRHSLSVPGGNQGLCRGFNRWLTTPGCHHSKDLVLVRYRSSVW